MKNYQYEQSNVTSIGLAAKGITLDEALCKFERVTLRAGRGSIEEIHKKLRREFEPRLRFHIAGDLADRLVAAFEAHDNESQDPSAGLATTAAREADAKQRVQQEVERDIIQILVAPNGEPGWEKAIQQARRSAGAQLPRAVVAAAMRSQVIQAQMREVLCAAAAAALDLLIRRWHEVEAVATHLTLEREMAHDRFRGIVAHTDLLHSPVGFLFEEEPPPEKGGEDLGETQ